MTRKATRLIVLLVMVLSSCSSIPKFKCPEGHKGTINLPPPTPVLPDPVLSSLEEVVNTPPSINRFRKGNIPLKPGSTIGVMDFESAETQGSGNLVSDTFSIQLFKKELSVVERQNIRKIIDEQLMAIAGFQKLTKEEIAARVGKITNADFILFGAVTQYHFENTSLPIPYKISKESWTKYYEDLMRYRGAAEQVKDLQKKSDNQFFDFVKEDLVCQMFSSDFNPGLHVKRAPQGKVWDYTGARSLRFKYQYLASRRAFPKIGDTQKELGFKVHNLEQRMESWKTEVNELLESYDKGVSADEYKRAIKWKGEKSSWSKYVDDGIEDDYIRKVRALCDEMVGKLKQYIEILDELNSCKMKPVPDREDQLELPEAPMRLVSLANFGITFKLIDTRTGDILWIGQASKRDLDIQKGLNEMVGACVDEILSPAQE